MPGALSSVLAPSSKARSPSSFLFLAKPRIHATIKVQARCVQHHALGFCGEGPVNAGPTCQRPWRGTQREPGEHGTNHDACGGLEKILAMASNLRAMASTPNRTCKANVIHLVLRGVLPKAWWQAILTWKISGIWIKCSQLRKDTTKGGP